MKLESLLKRLSILCGSKCAPWSLCVVLIGAGAGCQTCNHTGMSIFAEAKQTTITVPPGGGSRSFVEIFGNNFSPNAQITISFRNIPAANPDNNVASGSVIADNGGFFRWTRDLSAFGSFDFSSDPNVDVWITVKEDNTGCFAMHSIKAGTMLSPPFR